MVSELVPKFCARILIAKFLVLTGLGGKGPCFPTFISEKVLKATEKCNQPIIIQKQINNNTLNWSVNNIKSQIVCDTVLLLYWSVPNSSDSGSEPSSQFASASSIPR